MPPPPPTSPKQPRVANFLDADDDDGDFHEEHSTPSTPVRKLKAKRKHGHSPKVNGDCEGPRSAKKKRVEVNGVKGKDGGAEGRMKEAARLLETRKNLPFYQGRKMILEEIMSNDTTIILGETGCGKSTQLPQLLRFHPLSLSTYTRPLKNPGPSIAITQPRRLPAISLAARVAQEAGSVLGGEVGYSVRFEDVTSRETKVRYLTEGVLMRELSGDLSGDDKEEEEAVGESYKGLNLLLHYDIIILDEAHERTLNTDFLCGTLKKVQRIRKELTRRQRESEEKGEKITGKRMKELKLVVMSATLDPSKFKDFLETGRDALLVKGRMYEVTTQHVMEPVEDYIEAAARQVMSIHCTSGAEGDILVFMPGSEEIENCVELLKRAASQLPDTHAALQALPLYAALPPAAQSKIFTPPPSSTRRVIVSTNIAETSMTIPGVAYVVDTGYKKEKEYVFRNSGALEHLRKKGISRAAAWQRTGRAGRERAGHSYRLYTEKFFNDMPEFDAPEIQRCNLSSAVLQLIAMGQNPFEFEYIDSPGRESILAAYQELSGLSAISSATSLTDIGRQMLLFPLDPPHARILLASFALGCPAEIIDILSLANAGGNLWVDKVSERDQAAEARSKFINREGDHLTGMNVLRAYLELKEAKQDPSSAARGLDTSQTLQGWCKTNHVNAKTLTQAIKIRAQLRELCERHGKDWKTTCGAEWGVVGRALLSGLFMNSAVIQADGTYRQTAGNLTVKIHPSSVLMSKKVPAILYDELAITTSFYARNVSAFEQQWLTEIPWFKQAGTGVAKAVEKRSV
ncbi:hypothetical protein, variant 1 [Cryptococcus amylolentus CBS 6039]|uniref:RNA helicase n=1 Tax=Cryptococcus amylolentus CBS 6039 TaxID=1295533 RepID=A0A1E3I2D2_9TREE|nr:hypothetical protein L202_00964 [Cryptococcus amylolentus CBS 6039]XP_018996668.1 hypothetical protein, variant 1 [Cryptococcus amylolentus CBS 6039]ODN82667.1 hypothetical protein L202_00964 [Cryptococcus amylolentus CBS 6039]ODN82668.1 hypothetical protein, variant 1 [Cryptococcus amylolentus CBS 6039]